MEIEKIFDNQIHLLFVICLNLFVINTEMFGSKVSKDDSLGKELST